MSKGPKVEILSWNDIYNDALQTALKIKSTDYRPDAIIGVTRGGWIHARLQCDLLGVKDLYAVKVEHWGVTAQPDGMAKLTVPIDSQYVKNKNILVIDDVTDTGKSLMLVVNHLKELNTAKSVKTGTLLHINGSEFLPDFYGTEVEWAWFSWPWNIYEDLANLIIAIFKGESTAHISSSDEIIELLGQYNEITLTKHQLSPIKEHMIWLKKIKSTTTDAWELP